MEINNISVINTNMDNIICGIKILVNEINSGRESNAMKIAYSVFEGVENLTNMLRATTDFHQEDASTEKVNEILAEMIEAFENEDYVLVSDLFEYEFLPVLEEIKSSIKELILE